MHVLSAVAALRSDRRMALALEPFRAILRLLGLGSRFVQVGPRLPPALPCPWLPPSRTVADPVVGDYSQERIEQTRPILRTGAASIFGANAVTACLAPLKLTCRGSIPFSAAATAISVRSRFRLPDLRDFGLGPSPEFRADRRSSS